MCLHHPWPRRPEKTMGTHPAEHDLEPTASEEVSRVLPAHSTEVSVTSRSQAACCNCPNGCAAWGCVCSGWERPVGAMSAAVGCVALTALARRRTRSRPHADTARRRNTQQVRTHNLDSTNC